MSLGAQLGSRFQPHFAATAIYRWPVVPLLTPACISFAEAVPSAWTCSDMFISKTWTLGFSLADLVAY